MRSWAGSGELGRGRGGEGRPQGWAGGSPGGEGGRPRARAGEKREKQAGRGPVEEEREDSACFYFSISFFFSFSIS